MDGYRYHTPCHAFIACMAALFVWAVYAAMESLCRRPFNFTVLPLDSP